LYSPSSTHLAEASDHELLPDLLLLSFLWFGLMSNVGDDSVFDDLKISKDEYPKVPTTW
jgi:hypothetical protein